MPKMPKKVLPSQRHLDFRSDMIGVIRKYQDLPAQELLAVTSHLVGQLVALQDQTKFTSETVMLVVSENIQAGNEEVVRGLLTQTQGNA